MQKDAVVIASIARTPQGNMLGALKNISATELGGIAIKAAIERASLSPDVVSDVMMGCVLSAGLGQAPARQAALAAGIPVSVPCVTINKMCGSGLKAILMGHDALLAGSADIVVAGGMESMSNAPYLLHRAREGYRLGHAPLIDHMFYDGLEDAYDKGKLMGEFAEICATEYQFTRAEQDAFATESLKRAQKACAEKIFANELIPVVVKTRQGEIIVDMDEHPGSVDIGKIPTLKSVFSLNGTITAANASSIADGAAAVVLIRESEAKKYGVKSLARIVAHATFAKKPAEFITAPIDAIKKLLQKSQWKMEDVDLFEINEAFAVVAMAAMRDLNIPHAKLNIHGGGCALGHPIGATGARLVVTLIAALRQKNLKRGIAALCIGGGEAIAIAVEMESHHA